MGKQKFTRLTKILSVLLLFSFIMFVTAASASGNTHIDASAHVRDASASESNGYGSRDSKIGSLSGSQYGHKEGYNDGLEAVSYTHLRAHETDSYLVCRLLL